MSAGILAGQRGEYAGAHEGDIRICGASVAGADPATRRGLGLTFVPEERLGRGAVPAMSLAENAVLTGARSGLVTSGLIKHAAAREFARATISQFQVKGGDEGSAAESLSGGNLQKFIVGRETRLAPKVMIAAQPTWGVDVGASQLIRQALIDLRDRGVALLVVSEELDELFTICDRIAVIAGGRLSQALETTQLTREGIGTLMAGGAVGAVRNA